MILLMTNTKEEVNISKLYGQECLLSKNDFMKKYQIKEHGLSSKEAEYKLKQLGPNMIKQAKPKRWYHYFLESLFSPFNSILLRYCSYFILYRCLSSRNS